VTLQTGATAESEARQATEEALRQAHLKLEDLKSVVATGSGRMNVPFARKDLSLETCLARGAVSSFPRPGRSSMRAPKVPRPSGFRPRA